MSNSILIQNLRGEKTERIPFWFMRQAGRYLPEYKEVRCTCKNFLDFCYTPEKASLVTLQPLKRFDMDAAIIFSDILVIPDALGMDVTFVQGEGPKLAALTTQDDITALSVQNLSAYLAPVYEAISLTRAQLDKTKSLIGFCGSPWTLACYMLEGGGSKDFAKTREFSYKHKDAFSMLIKCLTHAVIMHAQNQIHAGADVIQLFDSWAGIASENQFWDWVITPTQMIVEELAKTHPSIPVIGFPKSAGNGYKNYAIHTQVNGLSVDFSMPLNEIKNTLQPTVCVQGNLDPLLLSSNKEAMLQQAENIISTLKNAPFIFNLGHGVVPHTPIENVGALSAFIREQRR